jgi:hypothetical protein
MVITRIRVETQWKNVPHTNAHAGNNDVSILDEEEDHAADDRRHHYRGMFHKAGDDYL